MHENNKSSSKYYKMFVLGWQDFNCFTFLFQGYILNMYIFFIRKKINSPNNGNTDISLYS